MAATVSPRLHGGETEPEPARRARERQSQDLPRRGSELAAERARVVRKSVLLGERTYAGRQLGVAIAGQVREEVMLDLMAQVPGENVEERAALDVAGTEQLPGVPARSCLALHVARV